MLTLTRRSFRTSSSVKRAFCAGAALLTLTSVTACSDDSSNEPGEAEPASTKALSTDDLGRYAYSLLFVLDQYLVENKSFPEQFTAADLEALDAALPEGAELTSWERLAKDQVRLCVTSGENWANYNSPDKSVGTGEDGSCAYDGERYRDGEVINPSDETRLAMITDPGKTVALGLYTVTPYPQSLSKSRFESLIPSMPGYAVFGGYQRLNEASAAVCIEHAEGGHAWFPLIAESEPVGYDPDTNCGKAPADAFVEVTELDRDVIEKVVNTIRSAVLIAKINASDPEPGEVFEADETDNLPAPDDVTDADLAQAADPYDASDLITEFSVDSFTPDGVDYRICVRNLAGAWIAYDSKTEVTSSGPVGECKF